MADTTYANLTHTASQVDDILSNSSAHMANTNIHVTQDEKSKWDAKIPLGVGTELENGADLFALTVGKYYRTSSSTAVSNLPSGVSGAFYCEVVNTTDTTKTQIRLFEATAGGASAIYIANKSGQSYGSWKKFVDDVTIAQIALGSASVIDATQQSPVSLDSLTTIGRYTAGATASQYITNQPNTGAGQSFGFVVEVATIFSTNRYKQTIYYNATALSGKFYERYYYSGGWSDWYVFSGEQIST